MRELVAGFVLLSAAGLAAGQTRYFSADDLPKIVRLSEPQISPDGKTIAFSVSRANLKEDKWDSEIDFVNVASKQLRVVTHERAGAGMARWSPSGDRLAFLSPDANKKSQVFVMPLTGGDAMQATHSKTGVSSLVWRPDGAAIAFAAADEEPEKKDEAKFEDAFEVGNNDDLARTRPMPVHLWMVTLDDGKEKRLTHGPWSIPVGYPSAPAAMGFTGDGASIVFARAETPITGDTDTARLMVLNVVSGETKPLTGVQSQEDHAVLSNDGTMVAFLGPRAADRGNDTSLFVVPAHGGKPVDAAFALDRSIAGMAWLPDGKTLLLGAPDHTKIGVWLLPVGGKATRLALGGLNPSAQMNVGKDGSVAFTASTADRPAELYWMAKPGDAPVQMTHLQTVTEGVKLGRSETVHWTQDKFDESGVLTYPPEYVPGKKYAMVLYIHGGPKAASVETFAPSAQILAAQGWLVFEPNYRGSDSDGNAYEAAIMRNSGVGPGHDVMAGIKMLEARGIVDERRIAVSGWSYGGYMTSWMIGNYPEVWKAAVAGAPVTDLTDQYALSDVHWLSRDLFGPSPYVGDNRALYVAESPITYAPKMRTPTLILSDVGDYRVPTTEAYKLYHALKDNGVAVKFIAYPVTGHSPSDPIRARDVWRRWVAWLGPYLKDES